MRSKQRQPEMGNCVPISPSNGTLLEEGSACPIATVRAALLQHANVLGSNGGASHLGLNEEQTPWVTPLCAVVYPQFISC